MLIDTHCHLEYEEYGNLDELITDILKSDVKKLIVSGYNKKSNTLAIALAEKYDSIYATVGFHPANIDEIKEDDYSFLEQQVVHPKVVAIGEIGLDYHWETDRKKQHEVFKKQLGLAEKYNKPVVVHNREATEDLNKILEEYNCTGVMHCFNGTLEEANNYIENGFLLGVGGTITFRNNRRLRKVINSIPTEYIVLETDSPYLTPEPFRGKQNNPTYIKYVAMEVAKVKDLEYEELCKITSTNAVRLFDL